MINMRSASQKWLHSCLLASTYEGCPIGSQGDKSSINAIIDNLIKEST